MCGDSCNNGDDIQEGTHQIREFDGNRSVEGVHDLDLHRVDQCGDDAGKGDPPDVNRLRMGRLFPYDSRSRKAEEME